MIETVLERIAVALETIAGNAVAVNTDTQPSKVKEAVKVADASEKVAKPRGRPAKITDKEKETATPAETVAKEPVADFLATETKVVTKPEVKIEDVRAALKNYAARQDVPGVPNGMDHARAVIKKAGNGAVRLQEEVKLGDAGKVGILAPEYYQAVIDLANTPRVDATAAAEEF